LLRKLNEGDYDGRIYCSNRKTRIKRDITFLWVNLLEFSHVKGYGEERRATL
jgi:hypothetical protein